MASSTFAAGRIPLWSSPLVLVQLYPLAAVAKMAVGFPTTRQQSRARQRYSSNIYAQLYFLPSTVTKHAKLTHHHRITRTANLKMEAAKEAVFAAIEQVKASLQTHGERLPQTLSDAKLVPGPAAELIPEGFRPTTKLEVSYDGKALDLGNLFRVRETKVQPNISFQREVWHPLPATIQSLQGF